MSDTVNTDSQPVLVLRYPDGRELAVDASVAELIRAAAGLEYRQRYLTGCYRGMLDEAHSLMEERGVKIPPQSLGMLANVNKENQAARKECGDLYARFRDLLYWPERADTPEVKS